jgi:hypothetical protein
MVEENRELITNDIIERERLLSELTSILAEQKSYLCKPLPWNLKSMAQSGAQVKRG